MEASGMFQGRPFMWARRSALRSVSTPPPQEEAVGQADIIHAILHGHDDAFAPSSKKETFKQAVQQHLPRVQMHGSVIGQKWCSGTPSPRPLAPRARRALVKMAFTVCRSSTNPTWPYELIHTKDTIMKLLPWPWNLSMPRTAAADSNGSRFRWSEMHFVLGSIGRYARHLFWRHTGEPSPHHI